MQAKLVSESLNEYSSREHDTPWENWKEASKYILNILKKDSNLSLDDLVGQCRGWVNNMADKSRRDFYYAVSRLEKMNEAFEHGNKIFFDLTNVTGVKDVLETQGPHALDITSFEL